MSEQITPNRDELAKELREKMEKEQALIKAGGEIIESEVVGEAKKEKAEELSVPYYGAGTMRLSERHQALLSDPFLLEQHDITPDGMVYVPHVHHRRRLNLVFGVGAWALVPAGEIRTVGNVLGRAYQLICNGRFMSEAMGQAEYNPNNARMTKFDSVEAVQSSALVRCTKGLGMGLECWDKNWTEWFKKEYCIQIDRKWKLKPGIFQPKEATSAQP